MFEKIQALIAEKLNKNLEDVKPESRLAEDLGADSLDAVEIISELEDTYGIEVDDEIAQDIKTVDDLVKCLEKYLAK